MIADFNVFFLFLERLLYACFGSSQKYVYMYVYMALVFFIPFKLALWQKVVA